MMLRVSGGAVVPYGFARVFSFNCYGIYSNESILEIM